MRKVRSEADRGEGCARVRERRLRTLQLVELIEGLAEVDRGEAEPCVEPAEPGVRPEQLLEDRDRHLGPARMELDESQVQLGCEHLADEAVSLRDVVSTRRARTEHRAVARVLHFSNGARDQPAGASERERGDHAGARSRRVVRRHSERRPGRRVDAAPAAPVRQRRRSRRSLRECPGARHDAVQARRRRSYRPDPASTWLSSVTGAVSSTRRS